MTPGTTAATAKSGEASSSEHVDSKGDYFLESDPELDLRCISVVVVVLFTRCCQNIFDLDRWWWWNMSKFLFKY